LNRTDPVHAGIEPHWIDQEQFRRTLMPATVRMWLYDQGSLTAALKCACRSPRFQVRVLHQGWGRPLYSEARVLGSRSGAIAIVREVELHCDGVPWVFARTLIPASSLRGSARRLAHLGERPLGEVLFSDRRMQRGVMEMARLSSRHRLFQSAVARLPKRPGAIWGRRTLFHMGRHPLLVNELFLPDIPERSR